MLQSKANSETSGDRERAALTPSAAVTVTWGSISVGVGTEVFRSFWLRATSESWANPIAGGVDARNTV